MDGIFVTGTDTDIGKTTVSAGLVRMLHAEGGTDGIAGSGKPLGYWKPVQTGTLVSDDTQSLQDSLSCPAEVFLKPSYRFAQPLSPNHAAARMGKIINPEVIWEDYKKYQEERFLVVEGAGGVLVPLTESMLQIEMIARMGLSALLIAEDRVGAINHTLLTLDALRQQKIDVLGVVLTKSSGSFGNRDSIERFGDTLVLAEIPRFDDVRNTIAAVSTHEGLRKLFGVAPLPV